MPQSFNVGKCPKCEKVLRNLEMETIDIKAGEFWPEGVYKGVILCCPFCDAILSASIDQIALNADLLSRLLEALDRR